jgi:hypothetical protein
MFWFEKKLKWHSNNEFPDNNENIIIITPENDVYSGVYENNRVTLHEFIGMPFFSWKHDVKLWITKKEFMKTI